MKFRKKILKKDFVKFFRKGAMEFEEIGRWVIAVVLLVVLVGIIIVLSKKYPLILEKLKWVLRR